MRARVTRVVALVLLTAGVGLGGAAAAPAAVIPSQLGVAVGIADQKADMFADPRFAGLGIEHARLAISWDVLTNRSQAAELHSWLMSAREAGVEPLLTFTRLRTKRRALPTPERLKYEFRRLRQRYPWVTTYATWNEANHCGERLCRRPKLAAAYYRALRRECRACTILAPEMLDLPGMARWVQDFSRALGFMPQLWGLHNYVEANRFRMQRLRELLRVTRGARIWLTETGGLVRRDNASTTVFPEGPRHAANVTRYIFDHVLPRNPRIRRVYLYHWNAGPVSHNAWDSGLITPAGRRRSAFAVLERVLRDGTRPRRGLPPPKPL